jgi:hypothetical protein
MKNRLSKLSGSEKGSVTRIIKTLDKRIGLYRRHDRTMGVWQVRTAFGESERTAPRSMEMHPAHKTRPAGPLAAQRRRAGGAGPVLRECLVRRGTGGSFDDNRDFSFLDNFTESDVSHSQMTITRQPAARSCRFLRASRLVLASNFSRQNSTRVLGIVALPHKACLCQKHPCTKMTVLSLGSTRSGVPGRSLRCSLKRKPRA